MENVELQATCASLGYTEGDKYLKEPDCLETVKDLIRFLKREDDSCDIRRDLGESQIVQNDLIPLVKHYADERILLETVIRLMVNLTQPAKLCFQNQIPDDKTQRNHFLQIEAHLQGYKQAFTDEALFAILTKKLGDLLSLDYENREEEDRLLIERILILIRNILHVPPNTQKEQRTDDDASTHDQVLWALHMSGMEDLLLFLATSDDENQFTLHVLEIISLMFREQTPEQIASSGAARSLTEREKDERELTIAREKEKVRKKTQVLKYNSRHSRFGGTFTVANMKSITDRDLIFHRPVSKANEISFDHNKTRKKAPKNRQPITAEEVTRRSTLSIRMFLKEFCLQFLQNCFNPLMRAVKDALNRSKAQENDETYYLWAVRFFMEVNRRHSFRIDLVSETLSVASFHYVQTQLQLYLEMMITNKKEGIVWSRRMHLALKAYHELLLNLFEMDRSKDKAVRDSAKVIEGNVFYMMEYRDIFLIMLRKFDESRQSRAFLRELVETTHLFLKMLEGYCKQHRHLMVQKTKKKKSQKSKKKATANINNNVELTQEQLIELWDSVSGGVSAVLQSGEEPSGAEGVVPFDAASQVPLDQQRIDAVFRIQEFLRADKAAEAVALFKASREVWPDRPEFGEENMTTEAEFMSLREILLTNLPRDACSLPEHQEENEEQEEEQEEEVEQEEYAGMADTTEQEFDFKEFVTRFASPLVVKAYTMLLQDFPRNSAQINRCCVKMLHRIAFDLNQVGMLFQARLFRVFQNVMLKDEHRSLSCFQELSTFGKHILRKFFDAALKNRKIFAEVFFWKGTKEALEIVDGYGTYNDRSKAPKVTWSEEENMELQRLCEEFKEKNAADPGADLGDYIVQNLIDDSKTRRQVVRQLVHLDIITCAKDLKRRTGARSLRGWREEEEAELRQLYELHKEDPDPLGSIISEMSAPRSKPVVSKKLLSMGIVSDKKQLHKKRKKGQKGQSGQDWLQAQEEASSAEEEKEEEAGRSDSSSNEEEEQHGSPVDPSRQIVRIRRCLQNACDAGLSEGVAWVKRCLHRTADDRDEDQDDEAIAIVPLTEEQEDAMESEHFRALLRTLGIQAPANEQERFWRIPSNLTPSDLRSRAEALAPPSDQQDKRNRLQNLVQQKKENSSREKRKRRQEKKANEEKKKPFWGESDSDSETDNRLVIDDDLVSGKKRVKVIDSDDDDDIGSAKKRAKVIESDYDNLESDNDIGSSNKPTKIVDKVVDSFDDDIGSAKKKRAMVIESDDDDLETEDDIVSARKVNDADDLLNKDTDDLHLHLSDTQSDSDLEVISVKKRAFVIESDED